MYLQKVVSKTQLEKNVYFVGILKVTNKKSRIRSRIFVRNHVFGYKDQDPDRYQNVTDPEHLSLHNTAVFASFFASSGWAFTFHNTGMFSSVSLYYMEHYFFLSIGKTNE
jgi:hypothetical protein